MEDAVTLGISARDFPLEDEVVGMGRRPMEEEEEEMEEEEEEKKEEDDKNDEENI